MKEKINQFQWINFCKKLCKHFFTKKKTIRSDVTFAYFYSSSMSPCFFIFLTLLLHHNHHHLLLLIPVSFNLFVTIHTRRNKKKYFWIKRPFTYIVLHSKFSVECHYYSIIIAISHTIHICCFSCIFFVFSIKHFFVPTLSRILIKSLIARHNQQQQEKKNYIHVSSLLNAVYFCEPSAKPKNNKQRKEIGIFIFNCSFLKPWRHIVLVCSQTSFKIDRFEST